MKKLALFGVRAALLLSLMVNAALADAAQSAPGRETISFDANWRFLKGDVLGAEQSKFDDSAWRNLDVPHDWSIEGPFDEHNPTGGAGAFLPAGVGWYRKSFALASTSVKRRVSIEFDGVMANSDVWINGFHLGHRPYGYVSFEYELTGHLNFGKDQTNLLAVRADDSSQPASRWYAGAGIYRHVRLITTDPVHIDHWGTFVTTPQVTAGQATVRVQSLLINRTESSRRVALQVTLVSRNGQEIGTTSSTSKTLESGKPTPFQVEFLVPQPKLWDIENPNLYRAVVKVRDGKETIDDQAVSFGIRDAHFEAATGFWLNGKNLKIKGVCLHQDASALGVAAPLGIWRRRLTALRKLGVNAIRTSHNPPSPEFLDLCDQMGFLVMDELFDAWTVPKNPYDYHLFFKDWANVDIRDTVLRDRNHPSIILYSAGNEIHDTANTTLAHQWLTSLIGSFHQYDSTRPVTQALFRPNASHDYDNGYADLLDVVGQNYREKEIVAAHVQNPNRKIIGTENGHERGTWLLLRDTPAYAGQFLWTGIDYLGESRSWPTVANGSGLLTRLGTPRPLGMQRASWWSDSPMVSMARRVAPSAPSPTDPGYEPTNRARKTQVLFSDWTPQNMAPHDENIEVYSNCEKVELFLNGKSLGSKSRPADDSSRNWNVPFESGVLRSVATNRGEVVATDELRTAGAPSRILLSADQSGLTPSWDDLSCVTATVVDANGVLVPTANDQISFSVSGPGVIAAVDNADNSSHEPFQAQQRLAYQGQCLAIIKAKGTKGQIALTASAPGLKSGSLVLTVKPE